MPANASRYGWEHVSPPSETSIAFSYARNAFQEARMGLDIGGIDLGSCGVGRCAFFGDVGVSRCERTTVSEAKSA